MGGGLLAVDSGDFLTKVWRSCGDHCSVCPDNDSCWGAQEKVYVTELLCLEEPGKVVHQGTLGKL